MCRIRAFLNLMSQGLYSVNLPEVCEFPTCLLACFTITSFSNLLKTVCIQTNPFEKTSEQGCTQSCSDECGNPAPPLLFLSASVSVPCWDCWLLFDSCLWGLHLAHSPLLLDFVFCDQMGSKMPKQYEINLVSTSFSLGTKVSFLLLEMLFHHYSLLAKPRPEKQVNKLNGMFHLPLSNTLKT